MPVRAYLRNGKAPAGTRMADAAAQQARNDKQSRPTPPVPLIRIWVRVRLQVFMDFLIRRKEGWRREVTASCGNALLRDQNHGKKMPNTDKEQGHSAFNFLFAKNKEIREILEKKRKKKKKKKKKK